MIDILVFVPNSLNQLRIYWQGGKGNVSHMPAECS